MPSRVTTRGAEQGPRFARSFRSEGPTRRAEAQGARPRAAGRAVAFVGGARTAKWKLLSVA